MTVSHSSAEAEYRSMASTACELKWISFLLQDFQISLHTPIPLHCDNQAAIHISNNPTFHERTKHIDIDCHVVRDHVNSGFLQTIHTPSRLQLADVFTKSLSAAAFTFILSKLGLIDLHQPPA